MAAQATDSSLSFCLVLHPWLFVFFQFRATHIHDKHYQHDHSLTDNSPDNSHMDSIGYYTDFVLGSGQDKTSFNVQSN